MIAQQDLADAASRTSSRRSLLPPERVKTLSLVGVLLLTVAVFSLVVDDYLSARFLSRLLIAISITSLVAAGEALVIITRNIDLSVGSVVGVAAYLTAELLADHRGLPAVAAIAFALGVGAVLGVVNGILVAVAKVPSIIATLGTLSIYRSLLTDHAGGKTVSTGSLPAWIVDLPRNTLFRIGQYEVRTMFVLALVIAVVLHLVLQYVQAGRHLYALGSNPEAARQAGLSDAAHPDRGVHRVRCAGRPGRLPVRRPLRNDQRHGGLRPGTGGDRSGGRRRRQHAGRLRHRPRRVPRRGADRGARPEPRPGGADQRVLA